MLAVRAVKRFKGFVLDVDFEADGTATLLSGPSGAGKSLLLGLLAGVVRADAGRAVLDGQILFDRDAKRETHPHLRGVGCVFQDARLFPHRTVGENLRYGLRRSSLRPQRFGFAEVVDVLGLSQLLRRSPRGLSGGEAQRVAIGRALLSQPRLLLLDEPLSALDAPRRHEILHFIQKARAAFPVPMVYASHDAEELERLGGTMVFLEDGAVVKIAALDPRPAPACIEGELVTLNGEESAALHLRAGSELWPVCGPGLVAGARVAVWVAAQDVLLALEPPSLISADIVVRARVQAVTTWGLESRIDLETGFGPLRALVPSRAVEALGLAPGRMVHAVVARTSITPGGSAPAVEMFGG